MFFMEEKRIAERFSLRNQLIANLIAHRDEEVASNDLVLTTVNVSNTGLMVLWPSGWFCFECIHCRYWYLNSSCKLIDDKEDGNSTGKIVPRDTAVMLRHVDPKFPILYAKVAWANWDGELKCCRAGLRFDEKQEKTPFSKKIL